jgi:serine protease AprX
MEIPGSLIEFVLLGPTDDRRQLQDSPILGDVWIAFGREPGKRHDLLITPVRTQPAGRIAAAVYSGLERIGSMPVDDAPSNGGKATEDMPDVASLQGIVAARLRFRELLRIVVPMTQWWKDKWVKTGEKPPMERHHFQDYTAEEFRAVMSAMIEQLEAWQAVEPREQMSTRAVEGEGSQALDRFAALAGLLLWAEDRSLDEPADRRHDRRPAQEKIRSLLDEADKVDIADNLHRLAAEMASDHAQLGRKNEGLVWQVSLNRTALHAVAKSIPAVKADAATTLFKVDCGEITWAVLDSGIAADHPAFLGRDGKRRVKKTFEFGNFRKIVSLTNLNPSIRRVNVEKLQQQPVVDPLPADAADEVLAQLAQNAKEGRPVHWDQVERFIEIDPSKAPLRSNHGTHVAGILGANSKAAEEAAKASSTPPNGEMSDGMCPEIGLYDFRILGPALKETEFAIIAALQYIRHINERDNFFTIHGANLSLSIPHDVRNFACGRTPICNECERLVESGVVVVTAAGNHGYKSFETKEGAYESYAAFSITDPGNTDGVITVGSTHRHWPHTYGVSFFSSRGPTGDGRLKPDLVAPGERIRAPLPGGAWGDLDGTSMAAPHVSGAAAMLMARYSELIGQPRSVKKILCDSATDLGRERSFQGCGMLDVLRAFQSI